MFYISPEGDRYYRGRPFSYQEFNYSASAATTEKFLSLGFTEIIPEPNPDPFFYTYTEPDDTGQRVITPRDLTELKTELVKREKLNARHILSLTDWLVIRNAENGNAIPAAVSQFRDDVRVASSDRCTAIYAASSVQILEQVMDSLDAYPVEIAGYDY